MPSYNYLKYTSTYFKSNNITNITILWKVSHAPLSRAPKCEAMLSVLKEFYNKQHIHVNMSNKTDAITTLKYFLNSKNLVSLVQSSYSFVAGSCKDNNFITPYMGLSGIPHLDDYDMKRAKKLSEMVHWNMFYLESLKPHEILNKSFLTFNV